MKLSASVSEYESEYGSKQGQGDCAARSLWMIHAVAKEPILVGTFVLCSL